MKNTQFISESEAIKFLEQFVGASAIQLFTLTEPDTLVKSRVTKEPTPFDKLQHMKNFNANIGYKYEDRVNNQIKRESKEIEFFAKNHKWAMHVKGAIMTDKKTQSKFYCAYIQKRVDESEYYADGKSVNISEYSEYLQKKSNYSSQPTEEKIIVQMVKVENLIGFTHAETKHYIIH